MDFRDEINAEKERRARSLESEEIKRLQDKVLQRQMEQYWDPRRGLDIDNFPSMGDETKRALKGFALSFHAANIPHDSIDLIPNSFEPPRLLRQEIIIKVVFRDGYVNRKGAMAGLNRKRRQAAESARQEMSLGGWRIDIDKGIPYGEDPRPPGKTVVTPDLKLKTPYDAADNIRDRSDIKKNYSGRFSVVHIDEGVIIDSVVSRMAELNIPWIEPGK